MRDSLSKYDENFSETSATRRSSFGSHRFSVASMSSFDSFRRDSASLNFSFISAIWPGHTRSACLISERRHGSKTRLLLALVEGFEDSRADSLHAFQVRLDVGELVLELIHRKVLVSSGHGPSSQFGIEHRNKLLGVRLEFPAVLEKLLRSRIGCTTRRVSIRKA